MILQEQEIHLRVVFRLLSTNSKFDLIGAVIHGTGVASYTVSGFGIEAIEKSNYKY